MVMPSTVVEFTKVALPAVGGAVGACPAVVVALTGVDVELATSVVVLVTGVVIEDSVYAVHCISSTSS